MEMIGYDDFIKLFPGSAQEWGDIGLKIVDKKEIYVVPPPDEDCHLLTDDEIVALTQHPSKDLSKPVLTFPCTLDEFDSFIKFFGFKGCYDQEHLDSLTAQEEEPPEEIIARMRRTGHDNESIALDLHSRGVNYYTIGILLTKREGENLEENSYYKRGERLVKKCKKRTGNGQDMDR